MSAKPSRHADPIRDFLERRVRGGRMPGAAWWVGVVEDEAPRATGAVGRAMAEPTSVALTPETPFDLASLTKPLATATLAVLLEQDGRIDLDAPIVDVLPELGESWLATTTPVALARHTSRLPAWWPLFLEADTLEGCAVAIGRRPPAVDAGETLYSDLGYVLLGLVLERGGGVRLDRLFRERIALPLALRRMSFAGSGSPFPDAAATEKGNAYERSMAGPQGRSHAWRRDVIRGDVHDANAHALGGVAGHAGLFGPVGEVALLAAEIAFGNRLGLGSAARRRLFAPGPGGRTVGWETARVSAAARGILPDDAPGHTGFTGTSIWIDRSRRGVLALLTNRVHPAVPRRGFQPVRRGFHRLGRRCLP